MVCLVVLRGRARRMNWVNYVTNGLICKPNALRRYPRHWKMAPAPVNLSQAALILNGKAVTVKPVSGSTSRSLLFQTAPLFGLGITAIHSPAMHFKTNRKIAWPWPAGECGGLDRRYAAPEMDGSNQAEGRGNPCVGQPKGTHTSHHKADRIGPENGCCFLDRQIPISSEIVKMIFTM